MKQIEITKEIYESNTKNAALNLAEENNFIVEINSKTYLYHKDGNLYFLNVYNSTLYEILSDDIFLESMVCRFIEGNNHIGDLLDWYYLRNRDVDKMPFSIEDIFQCDYIGC